MTTHEIARVCYEVNRGYSASMGERKLPTWDELADDIKQRYVAGVSLYSNNPKMKEDALHENWMNTMNSMETAQGTQDPADYQSDAYVYQLDRDGSTLRTYRFHDVFPTNVSTIELNYETTDTIQEFTVEMQVQWWEAIKGSSPNAGGEDIF